MILKLSNKENRYTFTVDDLNNGEKLYYKFQIPASDVVDGKYNMVLMDDNGNIITEEQVCMGYFNAETIQYNRGENVYINSPLNANLEDVRTITIDVPSYTIYPSEGYDAMKEVVVDAQPVYDNGYNEGEIAQKAKLTGITITENGTYSREDGYNEVVVEVPDLNGDYNEGYDAGKVDGYDSGYTAGEVEQKSKLTNITISENGTYTREDGYNTVVVNVPDTNGSYDEGFAAGVEEGTANAGEIIGETARILNITENGTYTSEYSQWDDYPKPEQVTGVFDDGKEFYNEAYPQGIVYRTNRFTITPQTKVELWLKPVNYTWVTDYFSLNVNQQGDEFRLSVNGGSSTKNNFQAKIGNSSVYIDLTELEYKKMHHIVMSFVDGFWLDGVKVGDFEGNFTIKNSSYSFEINPSAVNVGSAANYGMFKIDDVVIIPTEDGFLNVNTNELLTYQNVSTQPQYTYYNNFTEPVAEGNLIRTVNVDVQPKVNVAKYGLRFGQSTFKEIPEWANFTDVTDMSHIFDSCGSLQTIQQLDTRNVTNMGYMFYGGFGGMSFITLPKIYCDSCTNMTRHLSAIDVPTLTEVGGWINLKIDWKDNYGLVNCPNLTYQSCINVLNGLGDVTELGSRTLKVHSNFLTTVGDEISIGTNKNWTITA